jgi:hypothetical protein
MLDKVKQFVGKLTPTLRYRIGVVLVIISMLAWITLFCLPFFDLRWRSVAEIVGVLVVVGEIFFILSIILAGRTIIDRLKSFFGFKQKS